MSERSPVRRVAALPPGRWLRRPGLFWFWLHVPAILAIYGPPIRNAIASVPTSYRVAVVASYTVQAAFLLTALYLAVWPLSYRARAYALAVPVLAGVGTAILYVDSQLYQAIGFHVNGLFLRVLGQPDALREIGISPLDLAVFAAGAVAWLGLELFAGRRFLLAFASPARAFPWAAGLLALVIAEKLMGAAVIFNGGLTLDAASQVLP